jgi:hypothetical protein
MQEITTKFKSCFEDEVLQRETLHFRGESGEDFGEVTLRQLKRGGLLELWDKEPSETKKIKIDKKEIDVHESFAKYWAWMQEYVFASIESWDFKSTGKPLELNLENVRGLLPEMIDALFKSASQMNRLSEGAEKNSERQSS